MGGREVVGGCPRLEWTDIQAACEVIGRIDEGVVVCWLNTVSEQFLAREHFA